MAKILILATFAYNTFNTPNLVNFSPYELVFRRRPKVLLNLETTPDIKVAGTFNYYYNLLNKRVEYLHKSRKVMIKYVGPVVIYKIIDLHNYLLTTLDGKILRGLFEHERLKPAMLRTSEGNVNNLSELKQIINAGLSTSL